MGSLVYSVLPVFQYASKIFTGTGWESCNRICKTEMYYIYENKFTTIKLFGLGTVIFKYCRIIDCYFNEKWLLKIEQLQT